MRAEGLEPPRAFAHQDLNLARLTRIPPRPRTAIVPSFGGRACGENPAMADPHQREQESREDPETKFQDLRDEERSDRERLAEDVEDEFVEEDEPES
jgi:hypothetical protein